MKKEDLLSNAKGLFGEAAEKAKSFAESAKKTVKTEKLDYEITKKYREIGKVVYAAYEEEGTYAGVADDICEEINALFDQIIAIKLGEDAEVTQEEKEEIIDEINREIEDEDEDFDDVDDVDAEAVE